MATPELVFLTSPGMGHLLPTVQIAERLIAQSSIQISAVIPIMKSPYYSQDERIKSYIQSLNNPVGLILIELPPPTDQISSNNMTSYIEAYKPIIERTLLDRYQALSTPEESPPPPQLSGIVLDYFCTPMIDIADKLATPSYVFFTCGAAFLSLMFRLEALHVDVPAVYGGGSSNEKAIEIAGFKNLVPVSVWPQVFLNKGVVAGTSIGRATVFRRTKGIIVNTFTELESSIIQSLSASSDVANNDFGKIPPIYPVGPIVNTKDHSIGCDKDLIMNWLDFQPDSSVVFLCFGSGGSFNDEQVKEIAAGLECSGQRFLWSLRKQTVKESDDKEGNTTCLPTPGEYEDFKEVLPDGFLERTTDVGRVIGWAPQVAVLSHKAVGAFVSHCGWNSILESLWFGVPILTWPIWAEQQLNAFLLVKELGLAVEIKLDFVSDPVNGVPNMMVRAEEVEMGIRKMMEEEEGEKVREKVKRMSEEGRKALSDTDTTAVGGSSYWSMRRFLEDLLNNVSSTTSRIG